MRAAFELFDLETRCKVWALYLRWWVLLSWGLKIKAPDARRFWEEWERFITSDGAPLELDLCQVNPQIINLTTAELYAEEKGYSVRPRLVGIDIDPKARALRRALNPEAIDVDAPSSSSTSIPTTRAEQLAQLEPILDRVLGPCVDLDGVEQIDPQADELELFNKICRAPSEPIDLDSAADLCWRAARRRARIGLVPDAKGRSGAFPYARQPRPKFRIEGFGTARTAWLAQIERLGKHLRSRGAVTLAELAEHNVDELAAALGGSLELELLVDQVDADTADLLRLGGAVEPEQRVDQVDTAPSSSSSSTLAPAAAARSWSAAGQLELHGLGEILLAGAARAPRGPRRDSSSSTRTSPRPVEPEPVDIAGVHSLVDLAVAEEPKASMQKEIRKTHHFVDFVRGDGRLIQLLRQVVFDLRTRARPGGALDVQTKAWLVLAKNGGTPDAVELEKISDSGRALLDLLVTLPQFMQYANPADAEELARVGRRNGKTLAMMQNAITSAHAAAKEHNWTGAHKWKRLASFIVNEAGKA